MANETRASFIITWNGPIETDEVSRATGLSFSKSWREGEPTMPGVQIRHKNNGCELTSGVDDDKDLEEHLAAIAAKLEPYAATIAETIESMGLDAEVSCVVYFEPGSEDSFPAIHASAPSQRVFGTVGAALDIDVIAS